MAAAYNGPMLVSAAQLSGWIFAVLVALAGAGCAGWLIGRAREQQRQAAAHDATRRELAAWRRMHPEGIVWRSAADGLLRQFDRSPWPADRAIEWQDKRIADLAVASDGAPLGERLGHAAPLVAVSVTLADAGPMSLSAVPLHDEQGRFEGYVGVLLPAAGAASPTAASAATPAPAAAAPADTSAAEEALSFSYTVSHDLRAPLRVVEGFARILKEDHAVQLDRVGNDHLDRVLGAAARMNQMIDALLAMARLATQPLARQPVDLSQVAQFVVDDLRRGAPERQIEVRIEPGMLVHGDPTLLRQVVENLIGNAWKYTQRAEAPQLRFARERIDGQTCYVVRDNGAGFDMRSADRLFGLFQRLHSASDFPGTGVGLASVKRIVARHGGRIWAQSEPGRGAVFSFTLRE